MNILEQEGKTLIEMGNDDCAIVFVSSNSEEIDCRLVLPDTTDSEKPVSSIQLYCAAVVTLINDVEFVKFTVDKFINLMEMKRGDENEI